ncbi:hypothetical protein F4859DRAFT_403614 [Xylaria cf. heliscus]|nr:hypothetical protein F4859DRAFT_403614 [Xylaria cf. heliscus]
MQSRPSIEGTVVPGTTDENVEGKQQKPKTLPCKFCDKRFRRVEHVQRHERTHTKEKPFSCGWARCGKTFGRRSVILACRSHLHSSSFLPPQLAPTGLRHRTSVLRNTPPSPSSFCIQR